METIPKCSNPECGARPEKFSIYKISAINATVVYCTECGTVQGAFR